VDTLDGYVRRGEIVQVHQHTQHNYYAPVTIGDDNTIATGQSQIATGGGVTAGRDASNVTTTGGADARQGGTAATGASAIAQEGSGAAAGGSSTSIGVLDRAKKSRWTKTWALISLILLVITIVLVIVGAFGLDWAGFIVAALAILVGVIPLSGDG
jgi:hypothetical protein